MKIKIRCCKCGTKWEPFTYDYITQGHYCNRCYKKYVEDNEKEKFPTEQDDG